MKKKYALFLFFSILVSGLYAQTDCEQNYGGTGIHSVSIASGGIFNNIAAMDIDVEPNSTFLVDEVDITVSNLPPLDLYTLKAIFYEENLGNHFVTETLEITGLESTIPGIFTLTFEFEAVLLEGGSAGKKYWIGITAEQEEDDEFFLDVSMHDNVGEPLFLSSDGGINWSSEIGEYSYSLEGVITVKGVCDEYEAPLCYQEVISNNHESGISAGSAYPKAVDLIVPSRQDFTLEEMSLYVLTASGNTISKVNLKYYTDDNGLVGDLLGTQMDVVPAQDVFIEPFGSSGNDVRQIVLELNPFLFEGEITGEKHYWVELTMENSAQGAVWWETTSISTYGYKMANYFDGEWTILPTVEGVYSFTGVCNDIDVSIACNTVFSDSGGATSNYGNNENEQWQLIPSSGEIISLDFLSFNTEEGYDGLMIYDGPDTNSPIISSGFVLGNSSCPNGAWTGNGEFSAAGRTFISTHESGTLTLVFTSNASGTADGWEANVTCVPPGTGGNCLPGELGTTYNRTNNFAGNMFDVTALADQDIEIQKFDIHMGNGVKNVSVYYKENSHRGFEVDSSSWTLLGSESVYGMGQNRVTQLRIGGLIIPAGETYGIYITISDHIPGEEISLYYTQGETSFSNEAIKIESGTSMKSPDFSEIMLEDAIWNGSIYYCLGGEAQTQTEPCLDAEYGQYPLYTYVPGHFGYPEEITSRGWRGEYSKVSVIEGNEYVFSSSAVTDYITLSDEFGIVALESGVGSISWVADANRIVRFYTYLDSNCGTQISEHISRFVESGEEYEIIEPDFSCFYGDGLSSNNFEGATRVMAAGDVISADDFNVGDDGFIASQIRMNIFSLSAITGAKFTIFSDVGNMPNQILHIIEDVTPSEQILIGFRERGGEVFNVYEVTFDLAEGIEFTGGTYWLSPEISAESAFWETTSTGTSGNFVHASYNMPGYYEWSPGEGRQAVFFIAGDCETANISDFEDHRLTFYPNPTTDYLNIVNAAEVENITIYNIIGQKIHSQKWTPEDNGLDVKNLQPGLYFVEAIFSDKQIRTFKIMKK